MELVTHTCGARLRRHFDGRTWIPSYYDVTEQHELDACPGCGELLSDSVLSGEDGQPLLRQTQADDGSKQ